MLRNFINTHLDFVLVDFVELYYYILVNTNVKAYKAKTQKIELQKLIFKKYIVLLKKKIFFIC